MKAATTTTRGALAALAVLAVAATCGAARVEVPALTPLEENNHRADPASYIRAPAGLTPFAEARFKGEKLGALMARLKEHAASFDAERAEKEGAADAAFAKAQRLYDSYAVAYREYLNTEEAKRDPAALLSLGKELAEAQGRHFDETAGWLKESGDVHTERMALDLDRAAVENAAGRLHRKVALLALRLKK